MSRSISGAEDRARANGRAAPVVHPMPRRRCKRAAAAAAANTGTRTAHNSQPRGELGMSRLVCADDGAGTAPSGIAHVSYTLSGAQTATKAVAAASTSFAITAAGLTKVSYSADDNAGNRADPRVELVAVATSPIALACASTPLDAASLPTHGSGTISGTITVSGRTIPFSIPFKY